MHTLLWIIAIVMAVTYLVGGLSQVLMTKEKYRSLAESQHWADDFSGGQIKAIGTLKVIGALGLVGPPLIGLPQLVPLAACGLMLIMAGAATTRFRREEWALMVGDMVFLAIFAFLAWGRFDLQPFV